MRKFIALLILTCLFSAPSIAQQITGSVVDPDGKAVNGSTISLLNAKDSSVVKLAVANNQGKYSFAGNKPGKYMISATYVGYVPVYSEVFELNGSDVTVNKLEISKITGNLKGVTVTSKKPMVEVKADKTVLNVEGSINAVGSDALELLRKSPGVTVDKDENITLSGKTGVQIYIDGRPSPLSGQDLAAYLKSLNSASIESIEIITNPSAKYDAAGNAGIINIRLKKSKAFGTNGSVNAGYAIGIYPKYNAGLAWNHRDGRVNIFGNFNVWRGRSESFMELYRLQLDTLFDQHTTMTFAGRSQNYKAGFDYFISSRSTVGFMLNGNRSENTFASDGRTDITYVPSEELNKVLIADNDNQGKRTNNNFNFNYRYTDTLGRELNVDADYGMYNLKTNQLQRNYYFDPAGNPTEDKIYNFITPTDIDIYILKADYERGKKNRLGFGGKTSYVKTTNDFNRYDVVPGDKLYDSTRSNQFDYRENINALYVNYNTQAKHVMVQLGLRMENTVSEGVSNGHEWNANSGKFEPSQSSFKRDYTDFFPSAAVTFNKNPMNQFGIRYSRRIDRPAYQDLNPFEFKLDEYTYQKGNTELRPQYTQSFSVVHTYKFKLNTTITYSHVDDVFAQVIDTAEKSKSFITKKNLATQDIVSLNVSYPFSYKAYSVFANLNASYSHYKADFGEGRKVDLAAPALNIYMQHTYKFAKTYTAELSGFYNAPGIWQGTFESESMWGIDAGIMKSLWEGKANIKASVSDIFQSMRWAGTNNFAGQQLRANGGWESRQFKLNFTYRFGSNQVKGARQRKTASEEEGSRVGSGSGGGIGQ